MPQSEQKDISGKETIQVYRPIEVYRARPASNRELEVAGKKYPEAVFLPNATTVIPDDATTRGVWVQAWVFVKMEEL